MLSLDHRILGTDCCKAILQKHPNKGLSRTTLLVIVSKDFR